MRSERRLSILIVGCSSNGLMNATSHPLTTLPPGYWSRPLGYDDIAAVFALETIGETFDDGTPEVDLGDIESDWRRPDFSPAMMSTGVFHDGDLVAYATVFQGRAEALVHPRHRGRGLGKAVALWTWRLAQDEGRDRVGQTISENEHDAEALFRNLGYEPTHTSWILRIGRPDTVGCPALPPGYHFRPYRPGQDDRAVFDLIDNAFNEWRGPGSESMGFENWAVCTLHGIPSDLVVVVEHEDRLVAVAIGRDYGADAEGWIEQVAVEHGHRGQELGRAVLEQGFRRFWDKGRSSCGLSTDSRTGALSLYEHVGMSVRKSYTRWTKRIM